MLLSNIFNPCSFCKIDKESRRYRLMCARLYKETVGIAIKLINFDEILSNVGSPDSFMLRSTLCSCVNRF
jgi:hypothetical protein